jgi:hypothetical protein
MKNFIAILYGVIAICVHFADRFLPSDYTAIALLIVIALAIPVYAALYWSDREEIFSRLRFWFHRR